MKYTFLLISLLFLTSSGYSQHSYKEGVRIIGESNSDLLSLYISLKINTKTDRLYNYGFQFITKSDGLTSKPLSYQDSSYLGNEASKYFFKFNFKLADISGIISTQIVNKQTGVQTTTDYNIIESHPFMLLNADSLPILNYWINPGAIMPSREPVKCYYYNHEFNTGLPPMTTRDQSMSKAMVIDSTFEVTKTVTLTKPGLYLFQKDSIDMKGIALRVEKKYYPKFTSIQELIGPLKYIISKEEQVHLDSIGENKQQFDKFWLEMAQNPERAIRIIRKFYDRVEYVNRNFTTFKKGWKTDKGLIYIVMGEPDIIEKISNKEVWIYKADRRLPQRKYEFIKTSTVFSPNHYVLIREKKHASSWFEAIDLIRKGIIE